MVSRKKERHHKPTTPQLIQSDDNSQGLISRGSDEGFELWQTNEFLSFPAFKQTNFHDELKASQIVPSAPLSGLQATKKELCSANIYISLLHKYFNYVARSQNSIWG